MGYRGREGGSGGLSADCRGYELRDRDGEKIGKVDEVFVDDSDRPEYLGVKTGLLGGKLNLIPADLANADDERRVIQLSESKDRVKDAPSLGSNEEISAEREREVRDYFDLGSGATSGTGDRGDAAPGYREDTRSGSSEADPAEFESRSQGGEDDTVEGREPWSESGTQSPREEPGESTQVAGVGGNRGGESTGYGATSGSVETGERRETSDIRSGSDDRETVRVSVWRQKARAERVVGDDGGEEVRIRKEWVEEEEIVEVEGGRGGR